MVRYGDDDEGKFDYLMNEEDDHDMEDDDYFYDPCMIRHEMQVEDEDQESCLEMKYDRWNYYEASIEDEIRTPNRHALRMRLEPTLHYRQKRKREVYDSRAKEEKDKRQKRFKVNDKDGKRGRNTVHTSDNDARYVEDEGWYEIIPKDQYKAGGSRRRSIEMLKIENVIPSLPLPDPHASASSDNETTLKEDYDELEEWIQGTRRNEFDQEAIRSMEEETLVFETNYARNPDINIISSGGVVFKAHTMILRQAS